LQDIDDRLDNLPGLEEARARVEDTEAMLAEASEGLESIEWAIAEARMREAGARLPADHARRHLQALETESLTIARMLESGSASGTFRPVSDDVNVDRGFETALGAVLGDDLDSSLDPAAPRHWALSGNAAADPPLPPGVTPFSRHVRGPAQLSRRLNQVGLANPQEAAVLQAQLKPGQRLVSMAGAVWRWDGYVVAADAPNPAALRLEQKNRLLELKDEIASAAEAMDEADADMAAAAHAVLLEENRLKQARDHQRLLVRQLGDARDALGDAEKMSADLVRQRAVWSETDNQLAAQCEEAETQETDARAQLHDLPDISVLDRDLATQHGVLAADRAALAEARAAHDGLSRENDLRQRRIMAIGQERQTWESRLANALQHRDTLNQRKQDTESELDDLSDAPDDFEDKRRALERELIKAEALRRKAGDALAEAETHLREKDREAAAALAALADIREKRGRAEERLLAARDRRTDAESRIRVTLAAQPMDALRQSGHPAGAPLPDPALVERDLDRLKIERERLGAVNLRADEEQKDLTEKRDALTRERDDIIDAIRKLRAAIQSLNREGRERLLAAFDIVNVQFKRLFTHLFGGGTAELQLIESDDPLEAGLEILARPPGKKPQTMTLLSGGEQALTAMALIFAVFLTNPAPICVLDEVDAPLDDHNVERYCNLMDEMSASTDTRFVIITHNPITMARMDRLFGVTMAEQGVSQLVSVDLQTAEQLREAV
ncbi:MAG: chromosome partition protein Smc, partial [Pseudomonadota bacterium]